MFYYEVKFALANEEAAKEVNFRDLEGILEEGRIVYNNAASTAKNKKEIIRIDCKSTYFIAQLSSSEQLSTPSKSFRYLTKYLVQNTVFGQYTTAAGYLFKGLESKEIMITDIEDVNFDEVEEFISDEELLNFVLHWVIAKDVATPEEKKLREYNIARIKEMVKEYKRLIKK